MIVRKSCKFTLRMLRRYRECTLSVNRGYLTWIGKEYLPDSNPSRVNWCQFIGQSISRRACWKTGDSPETHQLHVLIVLKQIYLELRDTLSLERDLMIICPMKKPCLKGCPRYDVQHPLSAWSTVVAYFIGKHLITQQPIRSMRDLFSFLF